MPGVRTPPPGGFDFSSQWGAGEVSTDSFANLSDLFARGDHRAEELVYARFAHRLVALARGRLHTQVQGRIDADDVTQSAFRSFFRRHNEQEFHFDDWDGLWALLARITAQV